MANTQPTPVGFFKAIHLIWLLLAKPARFLELQAENSKALNAVKDPAKVEGALVVRRAFLLSLALVVVSGAAGYVVGSVLGRAFGSPPSGAVAWLQIAGAGLLLWGTLFVRGWEIQTYGGITYTERVNQWIYRTLYCIGSAVIVCSLAW